MIIGIVAVDRNLAIGQGGQLPWHYSADMKFFKATTNGNGSMGGAPADTERPLKSARTSCSVAVGRFGPRLSDGDEDVDAVLDFAKRSTSAYL
jgi:hypothetical protein